MTSRRDLSAIEVAYRMFSRWRQEDFFKYLREEYALDVLVDCVVEPADTTREVPNPARARIDAELRQARAVFKEVPEIFVNETKRVVALVPRKEGEPRRCR